MGQNQRPNSQALVMPPQQEEVVNSLTHGLGLALSVVGVTYLLAAAAANGDRWQLGGCAVYGASLVSVYVASTLSHIFQQPRLRRLFRIADQALIFLLIAGTFTPIAMSYLRFGPWWILFGCVWAVALAGFISKAIFVHRIETVSTVAHVFLGWLPALSIKPMLELAPNALLGWMAAGGILYTAGTFFLHRDERVPYFHAVWHVCVIAGSALHYWGILLYCTSVRG